jgi:hypothetical protein
MHAIPVEPITKVETSSIFEYESMVDQYFKRDDTKKIIVDAVHAFGEAARNVVNLAKGFNEASVKNQKILRWASFGFAIAATISLVQAIVIMFQG